MNSQPRVALSLRFLTALKLGPERAYRLANRAGVHPATLSKLITGAERVRPNDSRIAAVGRELGLEPEECFEGVQVDTTSA